MVEVYNNLYVGEDTDLLSTNKKWFIVHCAKEPYHRQAVGYKGRALEKTHKEYLFAERGQELSLNVVDTESPDYFCKEIFDKAINFIDLGLMQGKVLVQCNKGQSRSPSIAFLYMASKNLLSSDFEQAKKEFTKLYPKWQPKGILLWIKEHWTEYVK